MVCLHVFFFNDTATTEIYTLSLHAALPIFHRSSRAIRWTSRYAANRCGRTRGDCPRITGARLAPSSPFGIETDRKSTRPNSSHANISYAVFCLKKKKVDSPHHSFRSLDETV